MHLPILVKVPNNKFQNNPSGGSQVFTQTDFKKEEKLKRMKIWNSMMFWAKNW
jgi:hypothetical protein